MRGNPTNTADRNAELLAHLGRIAIATERTALASERTLRRVAIIAVLVWAPVLMAAIMLLLMLRGR